MKSLYSLDVVQKTHDGQSLVEFLREGEVNAANDICVVLLCAVGADAIVMEWMIRDKKRKRIESDPARFKRF
jgi:hypothetical protein